MKNILSILVAALLVASLGACKKEDKTVATTPAVPVAQKATQDKPPAMKGKVLETMNAGGYTYVKVATDNGEHWAAGPATPVKIGDEVSFPTAWVIKGFESKTLNRTFDEIYFVSAIVGPGGAAHVKAPVTADNKPVVVGKVEKAKGGLTVAGIHAKRKDLNGKETVVRGKVVKVTSGVMGKNWLHIQDGSATGPAGDLTVTTAADVAKGDTVLVKGKVVSDKDFGSGYKYEVMIEDAEVTVE